MLTFSFEQISAVFVAGWCVGVFLAIIFVDDGRRRRVAFCHLVIVSPQMARFWIVLLRLKIIYAVSGFEIF